MGTEPKFRRVLLKISGEALAGSDHFGISEEMTRKVAKEVKQIHELGVEIAIVVGAATSGADVRARTWTGLRQTIWACWRRS